MEVVSFMFNVVYLTRKECKELLRYEMTMLELKMFQLLYTWIVEIIRLLVYNFSEFLEFYSTFFLYIRGYLVYFMCTRVAPFYTFNEFKLLI
jgi:hypothetical protein